MRGMQRKLVGTVVSDKMNKTVVVLVERVYVHPKYHKHMMRRKKYRVHDENKQAKVGAKVEIAETRPISRTKSWRLVKVLESQAGQS